MENISNKKFNEERALFSTKGAQIENCEFVSGESPLKESGDLEIKNCSFSWKYPLWYCQKVKVEESEFKFTGRSGIWYTDDIEVSKTTFDSQKMFRYSTNIRISEVHFNHGDETLWNCKGVKLQVVETKGDYFGFHSENIEADNLIVKGNYSFDSCKNVTVRNSYLESKDAFWNCENVTLINCVIIGEYIGWNSKNVTLINCKVESHQGFCYMDGLKIYHSEIYRSDLLFEYSHNLDVEVLTVVDSIKNPYDGQIIVAGVKDLILDRKFIDPSKIKIIRR